MGTIATSQQIPQRDDKIIQQELGKINAMKVNEEMLKIHGYAPPKKNEGIICLVYENVNGFSNCLNNNRKVEKAKEIHDELEVDIAAYCKHQLNMQHRQNCNWFNQLFKRGGAAIKSILVHNVHENMGGSNKAELAC